MLTIAKSSLNKAGSTPFWFELVQIHLTFSTVLCTEENQTHRNEFFQAPGAPCASHRARLDYEERCAGARVEPYPNRVLVEQARAVLKATGYLHCNSWSESHGDFKLETYELDKGDLGNLSLKPVQIVLSIYSDARPPRLTPETSPRDSYGLAREIKLDRLSQWEQVAPERISSCCTASSKDYKNKRGQFARIYSVIGHGEVAFEIKTPGE